MTLKDISELTHYRRARKGNEAQLDVQGQILEQLKMLNEQVAWQNQAMAQFLSRPGDLASQLTP